MKRPLILLASMLLAAASTAVGAAPNEHDHDHRGRGDWHGEHRHGDGSGDRNRHDDRGRYDHRDHYRPPPRYGYGHPGYGHGGYYPPPRPYWVRGHRYDGPRYVVSNYGYYRLRPPPRGAYWVRNNSDYLLIALASGVILDIATR